MMLISSDTMSMVGDADVLAVADHVVVARLAQHGDALGGRTALADEVDHRLGTGSIGELTHLLDLGSVRRPLPRPRRSTRPTSSASGLLSTTTSRAGDSAFITGSRCAPGLLHRSSRRCHAVWPRSRLRGRVVRSQPGVR